MSDLETRNPLKYLWGSSEEDVFSGGTQTISSGMDSFEFLKCFATSFKGFAWTVFFCDFKQKSSKPIQPPYPCRKNPKQLAQIWTLGGNALGFTESYLFPLDISV